MPFAGVNDQHVMLPRRGENLAKRPHGRLQTGHVIAQRFAKAPGLKEIALHIDDHQRGPGEIDGKRPRFGFKSHVKHFDPLHRTDEWQYMCKIGAIPQVLRCSFIGPISRPTTAYGLRGRPLGGLRSACNNV